MARGSDCSGEGPLVVGLAARNEVGSIARVAEAAAEGVATAFPDADLTIILGDNGSTDGTVDAFGAARVKAERAVVKTPPGLTGKGHAVRAILEESRTRGARALVLLDSDLVSIRPEWLELLVRPVLEGHSLVTPVYRRDSRDAAVTRHFVYPLVMLFTALDVSQPAGGEMALARDAVEAALARDWPKGAFGYGVDTFLVMAAAAAGLPIASARLGTKIHKPSAPKLVRIFREVAATLLELASAGPLAGESASEVREVPIFGEEDTEEVPPVSVHVESFIDVARTAWLLCRCPVERAVTGHLRWRVDRVFEADDVCLDESLWHECMLAGLRRVREGSPVAEAADVLLAPFLGRTACFWREVSDLSITEVERIVAESAHRFRGLALADAGEGDGGGDPCAETEGSAAS